MAELDRATRERLLRYAEEMVNACRQQRDGDKILKMSSVVLYELKRREDLAWMKKLLDAPHPSSMGEKHWHTFRKLLKRYISEIERISKDPKRTVAAWLYLLGWLRRLAGQAKS